MNKIFRILLSHWGHFSQKIATTTRIEKNVGPALLNHSSGADEKRPPVSSVDLPANITLDNFETDWHFGDWEMFAALNVDILGAHPNRAKLALFSALAQLHLGNHDKATRLLLKAKEWGCDKMLISKILIGSVHNTLGRASATVGRRPAALKHFEHALASRTRGDPSPALITSEYYRQTSQLRLKNIAPTNLSTQQSLVSNTSMPEIDIISRHELGLAWSGNTINTTIFRHHGIVTKGRFQYTAFYVSEDILRLVQRDLISEIIFTYDLAGEYNLRDAHNSISIGIDRKDHIHISYDHHATQLRYRRSRAPHDITAWTDELPMTGNNEQRVTYPTFILPYGEHPLTLLYRDGWHDNGNALIKTYDEESYCWQDYHSPILSGKNQYPWTCNAYWNHPAVGIDGSLHLSFVWRTHTLGNEERVNNINVSYARSNDNGQTWMTSLGRPYKIPITPVNAETVRAVSPGSNLINQSGMAVDSHNWPHIVFYADDEDGIPQYQHIWFNGRAWKHQYLSARPNPFTLKGGGTLQIPISRPEIVLDREDNAYIIYRGDLTSDRMAVTILRSPDYKPERASTCIICEENLGYSEPIIDRSRWKTENVLTFLLQNNQQPDHDEGPQVDRSAVVLLDVTFRKNEKHV